MKIINSEIKLAKTNELNTEDIENALNEKNIDFIRWAIVSVNEKEYVLNVSHKIKE